MVMKACGCLVKGEVQVFYRIGYEAGGLLSDIYTPFGVIIGVIGRCKTQLDIQIALFSSNSLYFWGFFAVGSFLKYFGDYMHFLKLITFVL